MLVGTTILSDDPDKPYLPGTCLFCGAEGAGLPEVSFEIEGASDSPPVPGMQLCNACFVRLQTHFADPLLGAFVRHQVEEAIELGTEWDLKESEELDSEEGDEVEPD